MSRKSYPFDYNSIFSLCLQAIKIAKMSLILHDFDNGKIIAETSGSIFSWGEDIEITIAPNNDITIVEIVSKPKAQIIDWGKSESNISELFRIIDSLLE